MPHPSPVRFPGCPIVNAIRYALQSLPCGSSREVMLDCIVTALENERDFQRGKHNHSVSSIAGEALVIMRSVQHAWSNAPPACRTQESLTDETIGAEMRKFLAQIATRVQR